MSLKKDTDPELIFDLSKIISDNANQLSTRKVDDIIPTSATQFMVGNLNSIDYDIKVDHQDLQPSQRDKDLASVELCPLPESFECTKDEGRSITLEDFPMMENLYHTPHSTELTTTAFEGPLNVQSSNMYYLS
ncbi:hypothetical protein H5410_036092 [Solanum commersonii]|uniref:Uncharacterized protein n=1 Tax=Solanum commersonii TaxID=4109 RepID=A0A9J5Y6J3_SOLCO|nr:hypothetical protein H5410_036092 [Solanum commersonii]